MTNATTTTRATRGKRGAYAKTTAKRQAILDAALEVFSESGYRAGSLRDVAQRVGMSEAGLLHHFPNKSALLAAVLERRDDLSAEYLSQSDDGVEDLRGLIALAEHNASIPGVVELYCTLSAEGTSPDHPAHDYFIRRYAFTRAMITSAFEKLERDGLLADDVVPARAAIATIAIWDGLQVQWLLDREVLDMADALRDFFRAYVIVDL